jgi:hypothetical protein
VVTLAASVALDGVLAGMARHRPVFHSEADMQHAFAWEAHSLDPLPRVPRCSSVEGRSRSSIFIMGAECKRTDVTERWSAPLAD